MDTLVTVQIRSERHIWDTGFAWHGVKADTIFMNERL